MSLAGRIVSSDAGSLCYGSGMLDTGCCLGNARGKRLMLLGIVSDTHGHAANTLDAVRMLEQFDIEAVLHCGDIGSREIPELFADWPTHFVFGNVDRDEPVLRLAIEAAGQKCHERYGELELDGRQVAFLHGDDPRRLKTAVDSGDFDLVCYGHTHKPDQRQIGRTLLLNPGAIYRANPHSVAVVDLTTMDVTLLPF